MSIRGSSHQPAIVLRGAAARAAHAQRAEIALLSDQIRDALAALSHDPGKRNGPTRAWLLRAQRARRARLDVLKTLCDTSPIQRAKQRS